MCQSDFSPKKRKFYFEIDEKESNENNSKIVKIDETPLGETSFDNGKLGVCVGFTGCYGFIKCEQFNEDIWFHKNHLIDSNKDLKLAGKDFKRLDLIGKKMKFDLAYNYEGRKMQAIHISDENDMKFIDESVLALLDTKCEQVIKQDFKINTSDYKWCHYCYIKFHNQLKRDEHFDSSEHQRRVILQIKNKKLFCRVCYKEYTHENLLKKHETGTFHKQYLNQYRNYQRRKVPKIELRSALDTSKIDNYENNQNNQHCEEKNE